MGSVLRLFPLLLKLSIPLGQVSTCFVPTETNILGSMGFLSPYFQKLCYKRIACSVPGLRFCITLAYIHLLKSGLKLESETPITV